MPSGCCGITECGGDMGDSQETKEEVAELVQVSDYGWGPRRW